MQDTVANEIRLVYVEDDQRLAELTSRYLTSHGVVVHNVNRGDEAVAAVLRIQPDVVLLDLMLPGVDGVEVCRQLRQRCHTPIIMVTARHEEPDQVLGLESGADDYVTKPFKSRELLARIRAQARRARGLSGPAGERIDVDGLAIDAASMSATIRGESVALTTTEFRVLLALARHAGRVLARERILVILHGTSEHAFDRSVDVVISRLRQKIEIDPRRPKLLKTVRGAGYVLTKGTR